ncbi:MAG: hypothetical protein EKK41_04720 [Hyphomicrobiales bacterium]|nr:MAG: hypothetical protein EKK41_04720 [Hyphomicrobiales bacterium]
MAQAGSSTLWLSVGVFDSCPPLERAIAELHQAGFTNRELCLLGTCSAFNELVRRPDGPLMPRTGRALYKRERQLLPWLSDDIEVLATSGILLRMLIAQATAEQKGEATGPSSHLIEELCRKLNEHFNQSAIALLVSASDQNQQNEGVRVLLRNSFHTVQTYAVRTPRSFAFDRIATADA